jgi:hypothetical protein
MQIQFRPATPEDVEQAIPLIYSSGPAAFDYIFTHNTPGSCPNQLPLAPKSRNHQKKTQTILNSTSADPQQHLKTEHNSRSSPIIRNTFPNSMTTPFSSSMSSGSTFQSLPFPPIKAFIVLTAPPQPCQSNIEPTPRFPKNCQQFTSITRYKETTYNLRPLVSRNQHLPQFRGPR